MISLSRVERARSAVSHRVRDHVDLICGSVGVMLSTIVASGTGWLFWLVATHRFATAQIGVASSLVAAFSVVGLIAAQPLATTLLIQLPRSLNREGLFETGVLASAGFAVVLGLLAVFVLPNSLHAVRAPGLATLFVIGSAACTVGIAIDASAIAVRRPQLMVVRNGAHGVGKLAVLSVIALPVGLLSGRVAIVGAWVTVNAAVCVVAALSWRRGEHIAKYPARAHRLEARRDSFREIKKGFGAQVLGTLGCSLPSSCCRSS